MPRLKLEYSYSSSPIKRLADHFHLNRGTYPVPVFEEGGRFGIDTPLPDEALVSTPLEDESQEARLLQLPPELLVLIMLFLPHSSLYIVRQTCSALRNLTDDFKFQAFRSDILRSGEEHSCITEAGFGELRMVQRILLRRSLCTPCGRLFDSGELENRLKELWRPHCCTGCKRDHPKLLFPQGQQGVDTCVGLLGKLDVCKHLKVSGKIKSYIGGKTTINCTDPEHVLIDRKDSENLPAFQRYRAGISVDSTYQRATTEVFRTFPLAKINLQHYPELEALKRHLMKQIRQLEPGSLCLHTSNQLDSIVSCIVSDDCILLKYSGYDFPASKLPLFHGPDLVFHSRLECSGHEYCCRYCGAQYFWVLDTDYVALHVRIRTRNLRPDSMDWLSNLTFESKGHPILNNYTEGILWCSDPSCGTNCGHRWLKMVEIFKRATIDCYRMILNLFHRGPDFMVALPLSLEYQTFEETSFWLPGLMRGDRR
ncbi:hypothetical protein FOXG_22469 [Fusarium oxysporum f. sp. lycopersici 4287]|uniref:F-box domain-containing protein n=1 Tax=Fusarium oxysporum f. sp. lycopersici (strain 4287 / CBS 123668 / FGSC 9935 / NRRL 34936) TaxID=426428 RepID=A0A0J9W7D9_FUSO4|nr:hypothetical protein FOXG_22469 [Fusarium oxysporum f. sp. lycopersici 4287]KAJ9415933.1 hypothetical protein QL093DRAFT_2567522 [Fusarium oxysporum]KNB19089.1 hypothetical protein FOXG_22469 [Fusarium oxysporum f. sp. lycopersici 4287]